MAEEQNGSREVTDAPIEEDTEASVDQRDAADQLHSLFHAPIEGVSEKLAPTDGMFSSGHLEHYFGVGQSAAHCIRLGLLSAGRHPSEVKQLLDFACGYGRVTRVLRAAFPDTALTVCDLERDGVDFCASEFDAQPVYSSESFAEVPLEGGFDLIWCGSMLTHLDAPLWPEALNLFDRHLNDGGLMLFTANGRLVPKIMANGWDYGLTVPQLKKLIAECNDKGFAFEEYPGQSGYGVSLSKRSWIMTLLDRYPNLRLVSYTESGWDDHQDVITLLKDPQEAKVPGLLADEFADIDFGLS